MVPGAGHGNVSGLPIWVLHRFRVLAPMRRQMPGVRFLEPAKNEKVLWVTPSKRLGVSGHREGQELMKAMQITAFGGPEHLHLADIPTPEPGAGEVRIRVTRCGVVDGEHRCVGTGRSICHLRHPHWRGSHTEPGAVLRARTGSDRVYRRFQAGSRGLLRCNRARHVQVPDPRSVPTFRRG